MDREEALKRIQHLFNTDRWDFVCSIDKDSIRLAYKALENQKTGYWIEYNESVERFDFTFGNWTEDILHRNCSECGKEVMVEETEVFNYCPFCGAKMKGENKQSRCNSCQNNTNELSGECYECVKGIEDWYEPISELKGD